MLAQNQSALFLCDRSFGNFPLFIQIAVMIIMLSVFLFLTGISYLFLNRILSKHVELRLENIRDLIAGQLMVDLLNDKVLSTQELNNWASKIRSITPQRRGYNQILIDQIIFYHHNFTGHTSIMLKRLFNKLKLADFVERKLKKNNWVLKAKGLREIQEMIPLAKKDLLKTLINHKNDDLRIEAQATYIRLNQTNPFDFFEHMDEELSIWHQILLFETVTNTPNLVIPKFSQFLGVKNPSLVSFYLKLIAHYQQLDAVGGLINLLNHPSAQLRTEVVNVLGKLDAESAEAALIAKFPLEELNVQLSILETIGKIKSGKQLNFLKTQFLSANNYDMIKATAAALASYPYFNKLELFAELMLQTHPYVRQKQLIINHSANVLAQTDVK